MFWKVNARALLYKLRCSQNTPDCFSEEYKYYNTDKKKCWKNLPYGYCIKNNDNIQKIEVVSLGDNYYYEDETNLEKYCVNSCHSKNKYIDFVDKKMYR